MNTMSAVRNFQRKIRHGAGRRLCRGEAFGAVREAR